MFEVSNGVILIQKYIGKTEITQGKKKKNEITQGKYREFYLPS